MEKQKHTEKKPPEYEWLAKELRAEEPIAETRLMNEKLKKIP